MTQHLIQTFVRYIHQCDVGIVVSIAAFQAVDPGSIPGHRNATFLFLFTVHFVSRKHQDNPVGQMIEKYYFE